MQRICTQRLSPIQGTYHIWISFGPNSLHDTLAWATPSCPHAVGLRRLPKHRRSETGHTGPLRPTDLLQAFHSVQSRCASDSSRTSNRFAPCMHQSSSPSHHHQKGTNAPVWGHCLATKASSSRNAPPAATALGPTPRPAPGEAEPAHCEGRGSWHLPEAQQTAPADCRNQATHIPSTAAAAELKRSWPSWQLPWSCRTKWRCPAAGQPPHPTWSGAALRWCWRSPGCPWPPESWPPSLQLPLHLPALRPNPSSTHRCPQGNPSNNSCRSSNLHSDTHGKTEHFLHVAGLPGGGPPTCSQSHCDVPRPELCRCDRTTGRGQKDVPNPTVMEPMHPTAPAKSMESGLAKRVTACV